MIDTVCCPACRRALRVPHDLLGQLVKCPACEQTFTASEDLEAAPWRPPGRSAGSDVADTFPLAQDEPRRPGDAEERPLRRRSRRREEEEDDRRSQPPRPDKVQAIAILTLVGGILAVFVSLLLMATCIGLAWPGTYFSMVCGIVCIIKGANLLGAHGYRESAPQASAILQIINIINLDVINLTMGILTLVFLNEPEVRRYYRG